MTAPDRVAVVTDSAASLPDDAVADLGIVVVPLLLVVGGTVHADGELDPACVRALEAGGRVSTSGPAPGDFVKAIEGCGTEAGVVVATVSASMSSTWASAVTASQYVGTERVRVIDTRTAAGGEGLAVLARARLAREGASLDEVAGEVERVAARVRLIATLADLDHLARSGRVPAAAARLVRAVGLQPMFEFRRGRPILRRPAWSRAAALGRMVRTCRRDRPRAGWPAPRLHAAVLHAGAPEAAEELAGALQRAATGAEVFVARFSSVMVAHTGPGLVGLAWWWDPASAAAPGLRGRLFS